MKVEILEVEGVFRVASVQHVGGEIGYEETKAWCEVVCRSDQGTELVELYVFAVVRQNTYDQEKRQLRVELFLELSIRRTVICHRV